MASPSAVGSGRRCSMASVAGVSRSATVVSWVRRRWARPAARLGWQLARLALAYGDDRIGRVELADPEAPLAESRWRWLAVHGDGADRTSMADADPSSRSAARR